MWLIETVLCEMKENRQDAKRLAQIPPRSRNKDGDCEQPGKPGVAVQHILLPTSRRRERTHGDLRPTDAPVARSISALSPLSTVPFARETPQRCPPRPVWPRQPGAAMCLFRCRNFASGSTREMGLATHPQNGNARVTGPALPREQRGGWRYAGMRLFCWEFLCVRLEGGGGLHRANERRGMCV